MMPTMIEEKSRKLKIIFLNIQSLRNKLDEVKLICQQEKPDIVAINEIWITSSETQFYNIKGYVQMFNCRDERQGGGCGMYVKTDVCFKNLVLANAKYNSIGIEVEFLSYLESIVSTTKNVIIITDSNIDLLDSSSTISKNYIDLLANYSYYLMNKLEKKYATRITPTSATIIEHAFTSLRECKSSLHITNFCFSDHKILNIMVEIPVKTKIIKTEKIFKKVNHSLMYELVKHELSVRNQLGLVTSIELLISIIRNSKEASTSTVKQRVNEKSLRFQY